MSDNVPPPSSSHDKRDQRSTNNRGITIIGDDFKAHVFQISGIPLPTGRTLMVIAVLIVTAGILVPLVLRQAPIAYMDRLIGASTPPRSAVVPTEQVLPLGSILSSAAPYNAGDGSTLLRSEGAAAYDITFIPDNVDRAGIMWRFQQTMDLREYRSIELTIALEREDTTLFLGLRKDAEDLKPVVTLARQHPIADCIENFIPVAATPQRIVIDLDVYRRARGADFLSTITALTLETNQTCSMGQHHVTISDIEFHK